jgi:hypothetical protein
MSIPETRQSRFAYRRRREYVNNEHSTTWFSVVLFREFCAPMWTVAEWKWLKAVDSTAPLLHLPALALEFRNDV